MTSPNEKKRFPLLLSEGPRRTELLALGCPRDVPWEMVAKCEADCQNNHGQSVETLASRGGLDPWELMAVMQGKRWREVSYLPASDVVSWLKKASGEETDVYALREQLVSCETAVKALRLLAERADKLLKHAFGVIAERDATITKLCEGYEAIGKVLAANGCDCECSCDPGDHDVNCGERCFACRISEGHEMMRAALKTLAEPVPKVTQ